MTDGRTFRTRSRVKRIFTATTSSTVICKDSPPLRSVLDAPVTSSTNSCITYCVVCFVFLRLFFSVVACSGAVALCKAAKVQRGRVHGLSGFRGPLQVLPGESLGFGVELVTN